MGWCITALVTLLSAIIAYFFSGKALKPLKDFAQQTGQINVNGMLDRLAQAFDAQRRLRATPPMSCGHRWR